MCVETMTQGMKKPDKSLQNNETCRAKYREKGNHNKSFLKENSEIKRKEHKKMRKLQTIYQYFNDYTKEQVDIMLKKLSEEEKTLIALRYGEDLNNPESGKLNKEQTNKFYGILIPKMKKLLANPNEEIKPRKKRTSNKEQQPITESISKIAMSMVDESTEKNSKIPTTNTEITEGLFEPDISKHTETQSNSRNITKENCEKVLELLRTPSFNQMISVLSVKESVIISLKLGYIDGKYFSTDSIAQFLGIEQQEVIDTTKKVLLLYKENINQFIDNAIEIVTESQKELIRRP